MDPRPYLEREGWLFWLRALLRRDPSKFYSDHKLVAETLPKEFRDRLPRGSIPREMLPKKCTVKGGLDKNSDSILYQFGGADTVSYGLRFSDPVYSSFDAVPWPFPTNTLEQKFHYSQSRAEWTKICETYTFHGVLMCKSVISTPSMGENAPASG
ncbi:hypothetical protein P154DRAFT_523186 [Amniculicola lignicola CBS 123094]|uniref:Uncharacterized protein n=1 Tax=Amniculicola lignicola CBS 123094 TaxID=1392246 RepID=A0A6A5WCR4_9PLEO|nr:hypothetical protein P154DRAFT_523186 [Amniculicola lignicola CBS 123094]